MNGNLNIFLYALEFDFSFRFMGLRWVNRPQFTRHIYAS